LGSFHESQHESFTAILRLKFIAKYTKTAALHKKISVILQPN